MTWVATAIVGSAVVGAVAGDRASSRASRAATQGANASIAEEGRQYDQTRTDFAPYRGIGLGALGKLSRLYGLGSLDPDAQRPMSREDWLATQVSSGSPGSQDYWSAGLAPPKLTRSGAMPTVNTPTYERYLKDFEQQQTADSRPDMSVFTESPDYRFNLAEGEKALNRSLAARGRSLSGAGVREGIRYASGMASNEYGNFYNRLANLAGLGQAATGSTAAAGSNAANNISAANLSAGNARATGYLQAGESLNNAVQGGISNYLLSRYLQPGAGGAGAGTPPLANNYRGPVYGGYA